MTDAIIMGILSLIGTLVGTLGGILVSNKLTNYRIEQLEKKVEKHNGVIERTLKCECAITELQHEVRDIKEVIQHA